MPAADEDEPTATAVDTGEAADEAAEVASATTALVEAEGQAATEPVGATAEPTAERLTASGEQWMQQQLACQKQELLLLRTEAERQWQMHEQAVCSQLQLGQVTQGQQHQLSGQQQQVQWQTQQN